MTCSDVERVLPELMDGVPDGTFHTDFENAEFENHVKVCPACSDLVSDLRLIASEARQLEATAEPSPRVWLQIAAQLRAEGLIHEPEPELRPASGRLVLVPTSSRRRWSSWWLVPVSAALLVAGSYVISHKRTAEVANQQAPAIPAATPSQQSPVTTPSPAATPSPAEVAQKSPEPAHTVEPSPSAEDQQFLSEVSTRAPSMRATYENQLQAVNADIRETQEYVNRNPGDADARQHLMDAYQQKALLYQMALDRIQ